MEVQLYSRPEHGSLPVRIYPTVGHGRPTKVEVVGGPIYTSATKFFAAITGKVHNGLTLERYFGFKEVDSTPPDGDVLSMFEYRPPYTPPTIDEILDGFGPRSLPIQVARTKPKQTALTIAPNAEIPPTLGIDLNKRGHEVRKLLFAGFGARIARSGYDPEDVLQDVYRGLLARNNGRCPFDVRKSSFGHYVHLVITCILNNHHRKINRQREVEQVGMGAPASMQEDSFGGQVDAAEVAERVLITSPIHVVPESEEPAFERFQAHLERKSEAGLTVDPLAFPVARMLYEGYNQRDIAQRMGVRPGQVAKAIQSLRAHAADWM